MATANATSRRALPEVRTTATHCPYCSLQCGMELSTGEDGSPEITPLDFPSNRGGLCRKGYTAASLLGHPERLRTPLVRNADGELEPATWDAALDRVAHQITACQDEHGRDAVGVFGGGGLTNEKAYQLGKFARVALKTPMIDYNGRFCMSSAATAANQALGIDRGLPFPLSDVGEADAVLLVGSNLAETMPPAVKHLDELVDGGGALIVADPRVTVTARRATLHLQLNLGTDLALANGLLHIAIREGFVDEAYIAERTNDFEKVRRRLGAYWPDRVERTTGVPVEQLRRAVKIMAEADSAMILTGRGPEQQHQGTDTVLGFMNLALALGLPGRPRSGWGCLTGQGNGQGGREHGQKADQLPGYRSINDLEARAHVAGVWGVDPHDLPGEGRSAWEMLEAMGAPGGVRALFVMGSNPLVSAPNASQVEARLRALDLLVVADIFVSDTARLADVVLPTTQWAEETGTMTNVEGRVVLRRAAMEPEEGVRSDLEILSGLADRLGCGDGFATTPEPVFEELRRASAGGRADYAGMSYQRIAAEDGLFWPCPGDDHPGTPRLFADGFPTPDGRARFHAVSHRSPAERTDDEYPLHLTTGRVLNQYQSGSQTLRVPELNQNGDGEAFVELNPALARHHEITEGSLVWLSSRRGTAAGRARITPDIGLDTVFMPFHWGGDGRANLLTNPALDPASRMPEFKVCAARIERVEDAVPPPEESPT